MRWSLVGYWVECCEEREASWAAAHRSVEVPGPGGGMMSWFFLLEPPSVTLGTWEPPLGAQVKAQLLSGEGAVCPAPGKFKEAKGKC